MVGRLGDHDNSSWYVQSKNTVFSKWPILKSANLRLRPKESIEIRQTNQETSKIEAIPQRPWQTLINKRYKRLDKASPTKTWSFRWKILNKKILRDDCFWWSWQQPRWEVNEDVAAR